MVRIVQWATGSIGGEALKIVIDRADMTLAGVKVYSSAKHGLDAGELVGLPVTGVKATMYADDILAINADVVIHSPSLDPAGDYLGEIEALLRSGKNVITHRGLIWPPGDCPNIAGRLEDAAHAGGVTLFGTGLNPGFFNDRIMPALTSTCSDVRAIEMGVAADLNGRSALALKTCAIGLEVDEVTLDAPVVKTLNNVYREGIHLTALQLGCRVREIRENIIAAPATRDLMVAGVAIRKGKVGGIKWICTAELENGPTLTYEFRFFADPDLPGWDTRHVRTVRIDGDPPVYAEFDLAAQPAVDAKAPYLTISRGMAALAVNAVREVVAAPPGFLQPAIFGAWRPAANH